MEGTKPKIAYIIPGPREHLTLEVRYSANAWWMDGPTLYKLVGLLDSGDHSLEGACRLAGITMRQYRYFAELHPVIEGRRELPELMLGLAAKITLADAIQRGDSRACLHYLRMKEPESYDLRFKGPRKPKGPGRGKGPRAKRFLWG